MVSKVSSLATTSQQMVPEIGKQEVQRLLFDEIQRDIGWDKIAKTNKYVSGDLESFDVVSSSENTHSRVLQEVQATIERYVAYLTKIKDPRTDKLIDILEMDINKDVLDNEVGHVQDLTHRRAKLLYDRDNGEFIEGASHGLGFDMAYSLFSSVEKYSKEDAFDTIHIRSSKMLDVATYTSSAATAVLIAGHNLSDKTGKIVEYIYQNLTFSLGDKIVPGETTTAFLILAPFFAEMGFKISQQGFTKYVKSNIAWEVPMNIIGLIEVYYRVGEILEKTSLDAGVASIFRIARIVRGYVKATNHIPVFRKNARLIGKALPVIGSLGANVAVMFTVVTLVMMELIGQDGGPFASLGGAVLELTRLGTAEGFEQTFEDIVASKGNTTIAMGISVIVMIFARYVIDPLIVGAVSAEMGEDKKSEQYLASTQEQLSVVLTKLENLESGMDETVQQELESILTELQAVSEGEEKVEGNQGIQREKLTAIITRCETLLTSLVSTPSA